MFPDNFFSSPLDIWTVSSVGLNTVLIMAVIIQMRMSRKEMDSRLRPWVGRKSSDSKLDLIHKDPDTGQKTIQIVIQNHGSLPARDLKAKWYVRENKPDEKVFDDIPSDSPAWLLPNEEFKIRIPLNEEEYDLAMSSGLYYGVKLIYHANDKTSGGYEMMGDIRHGHNTLDRVIAS